MKRNIVTFLALGATLLGASAFAADSKSTGATAPIGLNTGAPAAAEPKQVKLVKVATLNTPEANREFQHNVQVLQTQRDAAVQLQAQWEKETDTKKKADLKKQLDELMAKLNENNQLMLKNYNYSILRNYTVEIVTSNIYMLVSDEEAAQLEKNAQENQAKQAAEAAKNNKKK